MQKCSFILFLLLFLSFVTLQARNIDSIEARSVATRFAYIHNIKGTPVLAKVINNEQMHIPAVYVFSFEDHISLQKQGFVVVAGDDCVRPILAYSRNNPITKPDENEYSPAMNGYLAMRADEISFGQNNHIPPSAEAAKQWRELLSAENTKGGTKDEASYLLTTTWDQSYPYNKYCPEIDGNTAPVGCVATALSQILRYWQHPAQGQGSTSYMCGACGVRLSANFDTTYYKFDSIPDKLYFFSPAEMIDATATLCYHVGISVWMQYKSTSSGVGMTNVGPYVKRALTQNFRYDTAVNYLYRATFSDDDWIDTIRKEIEAGRPVLYCGYDNTSSGTDAGHAFVMDGYDPSNGFFHVNWGWGSGGDGWFDLYNNQLNVYNYRFTSMHVAIVGIQPAPEPEPMGISESLGRSTVQPFILLPNPTTGILHIKQSSVMPNSQSGSSNNQIAELFDIYGRRMASFNITGPDTTIDISTLSHGIYFLKIGNTSTKVVKK